MLRSNRLCRNLLTWVDVGGTGYFMTAAWEMDVELPTP